LPPYSCFHKDLVLGSVSITGRCLCVKAMRPSFSLDMPELFIDDGLVPNHPERHVHVHESITALKDERGLG